jgi:hypothetical protein
LSPSKSAILSVVASAPDQAEKIDRRERGCKAVRRLAKFLVAKKGKIKFREGSREHGSRGKNTKSGVLPIMVNSESRKLLPKTNQNDKRQRQIVQIHQNLPHNDPHVPNNI